MRNLLVTNLLRKLEMVTVYEGGDYFDHSQILWDSVVTPVCPQDLLDQYNAQVASDATAKAAADAVLATNKSQSKTLKQRLAILAAQPDLTVAEVKEAIMKLIKIKALDNEI